MTATPTITCSTEGCTNPATHQTSRDATPEEATAHWDTLEQNIRESGTPEYVQNRQDTAVVVVYHCDQHPDPTDTEALKNQGNPTT